jgi:hypothetical protein
MEYDYHILILTSLYRLAGSYFTVLLMDRGCTEENQHSLIISFYEFDANLCSSR